MHAPVTSCGDDCSAPDMQEFQSAGEQGDVIGLLLGSVSASAGAYSHEYAYV